MTNTTIEISIRFPELDSGQAAHELQDLKDRIKLNLPEVEAELSKTSETNDLFDTLKLVIESAVVGIHVLDLLKRVLTKGS